MRKAGRFDSRFFLRSCVPYFEPWNEETIESVMDDLLRGGRFIKATLPYFRRRDVGWIGRAQWSQSGDRMFQRRTGTGCSSYGQMETLGAGRGEVIPN